MKKAEKTNRPSVALRISTGVLFLGILGICGYVGTRRENRATVGVPVSYAALASADVQEATMADVRARLKSAREQELSLLESVIEHPDTDSDTLKSALAQRTQIVRRMEWEAQIEAVLLQMGIDGEAVGGEKGVTIIADAQDVADEQTKMRLIHVACAQTGLEASDMKIILVKK